MKAPVAKKIAKEITQHGKTRVDNYAWIRDDNWKKFIEGNLDFADRDILEYIEAENNYKDEVMADYKEVEKVLYDEVLSRIKEDDESFPVQRDNYFYYSREEKGKNYSILCRKKDSIDGAEEIYFDINKEAEGKKLYVFGPARVSLDNKFLAYGYNLTGSMERTLKIRDLETGKDFDWEIANSTGSLEWIDSEHFYYTERDEFSRGKNVYKVNIHKGPFSKELVFTKPEKYQSMFMSLSATTDREYFKIYLSSGSTHVVFVSKVGSDEFKEFAYGENDISYSLDHYEGHFYIVTNSDGAKDFKVMKCSTDESQWAMSNWQEYLSESTNECIDEIEIYNKYLVLVKKNNKIALNEIDICDLETQKIEKVKMPNVAYSLSFSGAWDHNSTKVRLGFNSPINAQQVLELDLESAQVKVLHEKEVPNFDSSKYVLKREMAKARDGKEIPLTIVHKKDLKLDGTNKAYVYAYGSYGMGMPAYFNSSAFSLIDRGMVYCIAHIRGGDDKGYDWYLDGKMHKKLNTFYDFIDSCEHLIQKQYTAPKEIAINGGSAGGLLMGAVTNMRPDLFGSVVADVPFVDVINTISDATLPLTPPEWEEWGNPIESKEDFEYMMRYSPYDNIEAKDYPPMLLNSGISDEQVTYWEPTKMVAKLRELKTDDNILLLNMKMHAGHAGASKKYEWIEEKAFTYSFILKTLGLK